MKFNELETKTKIEELEDRIIIFVKSIMHKHIWLWGVVILGFYEIWEDGRVGS